MGEQDPHELADELEQRVDRLKDQSGEVEQRVKDTRQDWERKRSDEGVPGASPPPARDEEAGPSARDEEAGPSERDESEAS